MRTARREKRTKQRPFIDWQIIMDDAPSQWLRRYYLRCPQGDYRFSADGTRLRMVRTGLSLFTYTGCAQCGTPVRRVKRNKHHF